MSKLIIHIGMHKSGTSSIQHFCDVNRDTLRKHGVYYPPCSNFIAHHELAAKLEWWNEKEGLASTNENFLNELKVLKENSKVNTTLLSSERFIKTLRLGMLDNIKSLFDETLIVLYVREPVSYLESAYNQMVRQNALKESFETFVYRMPYHVFKIICSLANQYGVKIECYPYSRGALVNHNVVDDFLTNVLKFCPSISGDNSTNIQENNSMSALGIFILSKINTLNLDDKRREEVIDLLYNYFPKSNYRNLTLYSKKSYDLVEKHFSKNIRPFLKEHSRLNRAFKLGTLTGKSFLSEVDIPNVVSESQILSKLRLILTHYEFTVLKKILLTRQF